MQIAANVVNAATGTFSTSATIPDNFRPGAAENHQADSESCHNGHQMYSQPRKDGHISADVPWPDGQTDLSMAQQEVHYSLAYSTSASSLTFNFTYVLSSNERFPLLTPLLALYL